MNRRNFLSMLGVSIAAKHVKLDMLDLIGPDNLAQNNPAFVKKPWYVFGKYHTADGPAVLLETLIDS